MDERSLRYETLADEFAGLIDRRVLSPGERLPSVRKLAEERRVSISTAVQAFRQLEERGLVEARPQSGFFVRARPQPLLAPATQAAPETPVLVDLNQRLVGVLEANQQPGIVPLGAALPAPGLLPIAALHRRYASVARRFPSLLGGASHTGVNDPQLVRQLVRRSLSWGGPLDGEEIVVTNSCTEAMHLCLRAVTQPGDTVAVESPAYYVMLQLLESLGLKALEIPTEPETGISIPALDLATRETQVLTPGDFDEVRPAWSPDGKRIAFVSKRTGDWDRNILHVRSSSLLLDVFDQLPPASRAMAFGLPPSGEVLNHPLYRGKDFPDLVDEAIWNLDFYRRLQRPDGAVRGGIESARTPRRLEPSWLESQTVFAYAPDPISTFTYAAGAAKAAIVLGGLDEAALADLFRDSAIRAWSWADRASAEPAHGYGEIRQLIRLDDVTYDRQLAPILDRTRDLRAWAAAASTNSSDWWRK